MVNLVAFTSSPSLEGTRLPPGEPWVHPAPGAELLAKFEGWEDEVQALLEVSAQGPFVATLAKCCVFCLARREPPSLGDSHC